MDEENEELVVVRLEGDSPAGFIWRGDVYRVTDVVSRWVQSSPWWRSSSTTGIPADPAVREVWRVEASPAAGGPPDMFDLAFDRSGGSWSLSKDVQ